jgi:DNA-binding GntR family transcriptional regulator
MFGSRGALQEDQPPPLREQAYERIKQKIVSLELPPSTVIDEAKLQEELELGRTPIREALQRLALERLVWVVPRRGMFVTDIRVTDLQRLFEVRIVLEKQAAQLAAERGSDEHWNHMAAALDRLSEDDTTTSNEILIAIDQACHEIMYDAADNEFLRDTLTTLYALSLRLWYYFLSKMGDMRGAVSEHRNILLALRAKDAEQAGLLMQQHIHAFQQEIQSVMLGGVSEPGGGSQ